MIGSALVPAPEAAGLEGQRIRTRVFDLGFEFSEPHIDAALESILER